MKTFKNFALASTIALFIGLSTSRHRTGDFADAAMALILPGFVSIFSVLQMKTK